MEVIVLNIFELLIYKTLKTLSQFLLLFVNMNVIHRLYKDALNKVPKNA
jgi:hypothetical protein